MKLIEDWPSFRQLCRRWLLDGQTRRRSLAFLRSLAVALIYYMAVIAAYVLITRLFPGVLLHAALLGLSIALVSAGGPLSGWRRMQRLASTAFAEWWSDPGATGAHELLPWLFALLGVFAGLGILYSATPANRPRFVAKLDDCCYFFSICWPLLLATAAILLLPTHIERLFTAHEQRPATSAQLDELEHFSVEERHFLSSRSLLTHPCAICLERFHLDEAATRLRCTHIFHKSCLMPWISRHASTCPTCRATI